ncbi:geranylgeranylglycerol-phosphate geranylgeranyltransferase [Methanoregula formicica]|uniref:Digeranylgeranylglyceryl phosphate synthase n=1 Tax=Methanoregula formicica (strain DSM 22288 / NBRC 105244 / SMSP) TaxID=593750 RepID=L0HGK1_METFS|nr:geranylgeranylglycerol-phosphate geranylgeranyltransferase [Methanoregula formicica]AGB02179.1 4-hydroxybenzoate polyprenyltransferase-like prenyltransferase [Methanoregula formicica SMSP]
MSAAGFLNIIRPANAVMAGVAAVVAYFIAAGALVPAALLLPVVVTLITAAGNVINDYFDAEIDAVNRADRPIPSGQVSRNAALWYAVALFLSGIAVCLFTNWICIAFAVFNSLLLALYAARLKSMPLVGNIAVSYLSGSMFLFGGAFAGMDGLIHLVPIAVMTFLAMMARELIKDAEDVEGDKAGGAVTLPIMIGVKKTALAAFVFVLLSAIASAVPFLWWGIPYLVLIGLVDVILLAAAIKALSCDTPACVRQSKASAALKYGMFASLLVFVISALFFG